MPSEIRDLKWEHVNWEQNTILLNAPKVRRQRLVPIFPELAPYLSEQFDEATAGSVHVFAKLRHHANLSTTAEKYVQRAGCKAWPKFWNSLRASRETDLMDLVGLRKACQWIGNSPTVAMRNYALLKKTDYIDAGEIGLQKSDAEQQRMGENGVPNFSETLENPGNKRKKVTPMGLEPMLPP